jgi:hypothetical protein
MPGSPPPAPPNIPSPSHLLLVHDAPEQFALLLQAGFSVLVEGVCTLREFICEQMNICGVYTEKNIQTIFLDGLTVDDLDRAYVRSGSRIALSAAMPGLVGAILRRGGPYAAMRRDITHKLQDIKLDGTPFMVTVRLYNLIGRDLARAFLTHGIHISKDRFIEFLRGRPASFHTDLLAAELDGRPLAGLDADSLDRTWTCEELFLQLSPDK